MAEVKDVLDFLTKNGLAEATAALLEDIIDRDRVVRGAPKNFLFDPVLPPVRIGGGSVGGELVFECRSSTEEEEESSSTLSDEEFLSIGCSPAMEDVIELNNPFGTWPSVRAGADDSSSGISEFGTARDYTHSNIFSDTNWYDERFGGCSRDSYLERTNSIGSWSEERFFMATQDDNKYGKQKNSEFLSESSICHLGRPGVEGGCEDCTKIFGSSGQDHEKKASTNPLEWVGYSNPLPLPKSDAFEKAEEVPRTIKSESFSSGHLGYTSNSSAYGYSRAVEKELHILTSSSVGRGEIEDPGEGFWEGDPSDFSFHTLNPFKQEHKKEPETSEKDDSAHADNCREFDNEEITLLDHPTKGRLANGESTNGLLFGLDICDIFERSSQSNLKDASEVEEQGEMVSHVHSHEVVVNKTDGNHDLLMCEANDSEYEIFELRIVHRKNRTGFEESKDLPIILNSIIAGRYYVTEYLGSAAFSKVVQAHDLQTGIDVSLKIIKNNKEFFDQSLDEIKLLRFVNKNDPADEYHILRLFDYFYHQEHLFIVCELLKANLYEFQKYNQESGGELYFTFPRIQSIAKQCLRALEYLHHLGIIHCDLKPENILIKSYSRCEIKIIDLGSSCFKTDSLTFYVQSRSYRAPEVILGVQYNEKIDIWSLGCILAELFSGEVLFPNESVATLLARVIGMLGPFDMEMLNTGEETHKYFTDHFDVYHKNEETDQVEFITPKKTSLAQHLDFADPVFTDFLTNLLQTNPQRRPTATEALQHPWLSYTYQ